MFGLPWGWLLTFVTIGPEQPAAHTVTARRSANIVAHLAGVGPLHLLSVRADAASLGHGLIGAGPLRLLPVRAAAATSIARPMHRSRSAASSNRPS